MNDPMGGANSTTNTYLPVATCVILVAEIAICLVHLVLNHVYFTKLGLAFPEDSDVERLNGGCSGTEAIDDGRSATSAR